MEDSKDMGSLNVDFSGPFSWLGASSAPSVLDCELRKSFGVYLWAIPRPDGYLVYYVGETGTSFARRLTDHYKEHAACFYHLYSPDPFACGRKALAWPGRYDAKDRRSVLECIAAYPELAPSVAELTALYRFLLAPLSVSTRLRRRIEAAIALSLYAAPGRVGSFQDQGIRYSPKKSEEEPIQCTFNSTVPILGLPDHLTV